MQRSTRLATFGGTLLILGAGTVLATQSPHDRPTIPAAASHEPEAPPSADALSHAVDRLNASGIDATAEQLQALAADYGLGGAIRLLQWADASGKTLDELQAMRDGGKGWGQIARELGLNPGIGSVMGQGGGHGSDGAPGVSGKQPDHPGQGDDEGSESPEAAESPGG
jgi:hypothetical protein